MAGSRLLLAFCIATLAPAASVSGRVWIAKLDAPLPNAHISLLGEPSGSKVAELRSGDDGQYQFADVPAGQYQLLIEAPGWRSLRLRSISVTAGQALTLPSLELELDGMCWNFDPQPMSNRALLPDNTKTTLSGAIQNFGRHVNVVLLQNNNRIASAKPDADGRYQFSNLAPGDYQIKIRSFGYRTVDAIYEKAPGGFEILSEFSMIRCPARICVFPIPPGRCEQTEGITDSPASK